MSWTQDRVREEGLLGGGHSLASGVRASTAPAPSEARGPVTAGRRQLLDTAEEHESPA